MEPHTLRVKYMGGCYAKCGRILETLVLVTTNATGKKELLPKPNLVLCGVSGVGNFGGFAVGHLGISLPFREEGNGMCRVSHGRRFEEDGGFVVKAELSAGIFCRSPCANKGRFLPIHSHSQSMLPASIEKAVFES